MRRRSSPGWYARCCAKSIDEPFRIERCWPCMKPSTTVRASSARSEIRASSAGSRKEAGAVGTSERGREEWGRRRAASRSASSVVTFSDCAWKLSRMRWRSTGSASARTSSKLDVGAPLQQRARLGAEHERLRGAHARAVRHPLLDEVRRAGFARTAHAHELARRSASPRRPPARAARRAGTRGSPRATRPAAPPPAASSSSRARPATSSSSGR